jgi:hypothetical protein
MLRSLKLSIKGGVISESTFSIWSHPQKMKQNHWPLTFQTKVKSNTLTVISFIFFEDGTKLEIPFEIKPPLIVTGNKFNHANDPQTSRKIVYVYFYCVHTTPDSTDARILHDFSLCINSHVNKINTSQSELLFFVAY